MKKLYSSGRAMPTRTGPSEPTRSSHDTSYERMTTSVRSLLRVRSISAFYSSRRRAKVSSMSATSNLYDVLKKVDWLAIFSPWAVVNRAKRYSASTKQSTCADRTPANNAALKGLAIAKGGTTVVPNRACELSEGNIFSGEFWTLLRSNCEAIIHANEKPTIMDNVSCPACPTTGGSGIEDGKPVRRERRGKELNGFYKPYY